MAEITDEHATSWNTEIRKCVPKSGNRFIFLTSLGFHLAFDLCLAYLLGFVCVGAMRCLLPSTPSGSGWLWWVGVHVCIGTPVCVFWAGFPRV